MKIFKLLLINLFLVSAIILPSAPINGTLFVDNYQSNYQKDVRKLQQERKRAYVGEEEDEKKYEEETTPPDFNQDPDFYLQDQPLQEEPLQEEPVE